MAVSAEVAQHFVGRGTVIARQSRLPQRALYRPTGALRRCTESSLRAAVLGPPPPQPLATLLAPRKLLAHGRPLMRLRAVPLGCSALSRRILDRQLQPLRDPRRQMIED